MRGLLRRLNRTLPVRVPLIRLSASFLLLAPWVIHGYTCADEHRQPRLVCLMYHRFVSAAEFAACDANDRLYHITPQRFESHLLRLREAGYECVSLAEALDFLDGRVIFAEKPVLITIDDGCESIDRVAAPILRNTGGRATIFVTTDPRAVVFSEGAHAQARLSDAALRRLDPGLFDLGTHGVSHRAMSAMDDATLERELVESRRFLSAISGRAVEAMAVPGNWHSPRVAEVARRAGYRAMFVSDPGSIRPGSESMSLPRINVSGTWSAERLLEAISPAGMARRKFGWTCGRIARAVFGEGSFAADALRSAMLAMVSGNGMVTLAWCGPVMITRLRRRRCVGAAPPGKSPGTPQKQRQS